jgi:sporulation protein YlmC with PRC-barrel domain
MVEEPTGTLVRLDDTALTLEDAADDVRGRQAVDNNGDEIGKVVGLLIDETEKKVRFLEVGSGGFLGLGRKRQLIPVEAITHVDADTVQIGKERGHVVGAPVYDPSIVAELRYFEDLYGYWDYPPFWTGGYTYPLWRRHRDDHRPPTI